MADLEVGFADLVGVADLGVDFVEVLEGCREEKL